MPTTKKINANRTEISILLQGNENDNICLNFNPIEFDGFRDQTHTGLKSPYEFKSIEFNAFRNQAGFNSFSLTPKEWTDRS